MNTDSAGFHGYLNIALNRSAPIRQIRENLRAISFNRESASFGAGSFSILNGARRPASILRFETGR
jgi:hypothetical protein